MSEYFTGNSEIPQWVSNIPDGSCIKISELAKRMGVLNTTVIRWIKKGILKATQPNGPRGTYSISKESIIEFFKDRTVIPDRFHILKEKLSNPKDNCEVKPKKTKSTSSRLKSNELKTLLYKVLRKLEDLDKEIKLLQKKTKMKQTISKPRKTNRKKEKNTQPLLQTSLPV